MLENLPAYIPIVFVLTTFATLILFFGVLKNSGLENARANAFKICFILVIWLSLQALISFNQVYSLDKNSLPPKIVLFGILPAMLLIISLFLTAKGRQFIDALPLKNITYLNTVRVPVELVLYWLFLNQKIPELMTFEGRNWDILAGISAPLLAYFAFNRPNIPTKILLAWNVVCLGLLLNIVINAFLSAPSPLQKFAFEQPNIAILYFPFSWLPTFIVPVVLFGHLVAIRQLLNRKTLKSN